MKDMLAEMRQSRDDWTAQAERLSVSAIWRFFARRRITLKKSPRTQPSRKDRTS